jgi:hypothetical protein
VQTITPGLLTRAFGVTVSGDTAVEPDELFVVNLSSASGASIFDPRAAGVIVNDD